MRTSLNSIQETERFLSGAMAPGEQLLYRAKLLLDRTLFLDTALQSLVYRIIVAYGRKRKRAELEALHRSLFNNPEKVTFRQTIENIFDHGNETTR